MSCGETPAGAFYLWPRVADDEAFTRALRGFESAFADDPPAVLLTWNETVQAVSHRFVVPEEANGRDAMHFLNRWSLRQPGGRER